MLSKKNFNPESWGIEKIAVIGAGIVGIPMAAAFANARILQGSDKPANVVIIQRNSHTSGWKVNAINSGHSPIGGVEPGLDKMVRETVSIGLLRASHDYSEIRDAEVILVCVQTDRREFGPDYGPLLEALTRTAFELQNKPPGKTPLIIIESTLAPTSICTLIKELFDSYGLEEGNDILLGYSPNRVMPGRLIERITSSDKTISGLNLLTCDLVKALYSKIVTKGQLYPTNTMTAEIVKTLENAYRDVRIAYTTEIARFCDAHDVDFYSVRERVNNNLTQRDKASGDPNIIPSGGILIPTIGVGGHCLPKDGILLLWQQIKSGQDMKESIILKAREINDESPAHTLHLLEKKFSNIPKKNITLMGTAYRFNSEDTRNSPTISLALKLLEKRYKVKLHDPYVKFDDQNLTKFGLQKYFSGDLKIALESAELIIFCAAHQKYIDGIDQILDFSPRVKGLFDGCNLFKRTAFSDRHFKYDGIGKGKNPPTDQFSDFVYRGFKIVEKGFASELQRFINFLNKQYALDGFNKVDFHEVQRIAATCMTGCDIVDPGAVEDISAYNGFMPRLVKCALNIKNDF